MSVRIALLFIIIVSSIGPSKAQELICNVDINTTSIEGTNKSIFETLQQSITDYMNETKWTNAVFSPQERIECRLFLTVREYSNDRIKGDLQIQLSRPVFNSSYNTTLLNYKDNKIDFEYREGEPLTFVDNIWTDNLTGILNFYAYLMLALDFDSFSPRGGQVYYEKAASIVQQAQSSGETGWRMFEDNRNRSALLSAFTDAGTEKIRDFIYQYHRKGLDEMSTSTEKGRGNITESLPAIKEIYDRNPMSVSLSVVRDSKIDELVNIYSKAPKGEREKIYDLLMGVYPTDREILNKIKNPQ